MRDAVHNITCRLLAALLPLLLAPGFLCAETSDPNSVVTVVATRQIRNNNIAQARNEAVDAALSAAVDQGAIALFSPETVAREFEAYSAKVAGKTDTFINQYKIIVESATGTYYRVMLQADLALDQLRATLPEALPVEETPAGQENAGTGPRLLFLLSEQGIQDITPKFWWGENTAAPVTDAEAAIAGQAEAAGFSVIEHGTTPPDVPVQGAIIFQPELSNRDASEIGRVMGADVVIVGKAIVYAVADTGTGRAPAYNATITARAVRADNGQEIASGFETAVRENANEVEGAREALTAAGLQAAGRLIPIIQSAWENIVHPTETITLTVSGSGNLGNFVRFRQELRTLDGVRDLQVTEMKGDAAELTVRFEGNSYDLKERLTANTFELFVIEVLNLSNKGLDIALVPK